MNFVALKMLVGDRAKYIGIIIGLTFASLLITEQSAIFAGIMTRTFSFLTDTGLPDIWVVDPQVQYGHHNDVTFLRQIAFVSRRHGRNFPTLPAGRASPSDLRYRAEPEIILPGRC